MVLPAVKQSFQKRSLVVHTILTIMSLPSQIETKLALLTIMLGELGLYITQMSITNVLNLSWPDSPPGAGPGVMIKNSFTVA